MAAGDSILGLVDHILHHVRLGVGLGTVPVLGAAEAQDHLEDERQQQQADAEARALVKGLGQIDLHFDDEINVVKGDQEQQEFPATSVQLLAKNVCVVKGDDAFPALVSHLFEDHPGCHQGQNAANEANK